MWWTHKHGRTYHYYLHFSQRAVLAAGEVRVQSRDQLTTSMAKRHTLQDELQGIPDAIKTTIMGKMSSSSIPRLGGVGAAVRDAVV